MIAGLKGRFWRGGSRAGLWLGLVARKPDGRCGGADGQCIETSLRDRGRGDWRLGFWTGLLWGGCAEQDEEVWLSGA
jgi:hypothetical protein